MSRSSFSTARLAFPPATARSQLTSSSYSRAAAGQAMYERAAEDGSFGSESKSNENEADIVQKYVGTLVRDPARPCEAGRPCSRSSGVRRSMPAFRQPRFRSSRRTTAKSSCSLRWSTRSTPRSKSIQSTAAKVARTVRNNGQRLPLLRQQADGSLCRRGDHQSRPK